MKFRIIAALALIAVLVPIGLMVSNADSTNAPYQHVSAKQAYDLLSSNKDIVVLDIRTAREYNRGHISGAQNIDYYDDAFTEKLGSLDREKTYIMHCKSGGRSGRSEEIFMKLGFKNIIHMNKGFDDWIDTGLPISR